MTPAEIITFAKARMNEDNAVTPNWSDTELFSILTARINEVAVMIPGLSESFDISTLSVAGTASYNFPSNFIRIGRVQYNGRGLKYLNERQYEDRGQTGIQPSGLPREFSTIASTIFLTPIPSTSNDVIRFIGDTMQPQILTGTDTIILPAVFHGSLCNPLIADMFAKDLNSGMYDRYQQRWLEVDVPLMRQYAKRQRRRGMPTTVIDADSVMETEFGVI